jgi:N-acetylglutamate synthase-like GNAT family acetyltransferase
MKGREYYMEIRAICQSDELWQKTIEYALRCPWKAGPFLGRAMKENQFTEWERVFVALNQEKVIGFCTLAKTDCIPDVSYCPYIGYVFVDENHRGNRVSEKMIGHALSYAKELDFEKVYLVSDQINLYEKYGFVKIDEKKDLWGNNEKIYMHLT